MTERAGIKMRDISKRTTILKRSKTASHARAASERSKFRPAAFGNAPGNAPGNSTPP